jgi:hypothetical protein
MNLLQTMINPLSPRKGAKIQPEASAAMSGTIAVNGNMKRDVILVFFQDGDYTLVQLKRTGSRYQAFLLDKQAASHHKTDRKAWKKSIVVVWLPKSKYLTKTLDIPQVQPDELATVLKLEAEAQLPADYGSIEIGYTPLVGHEENGCRSYWVYICQKEVLGQCLSELSAYSLVPQMILSSSVCWQQFFRQYPDFNAVAVPVDENCIEVSFPDTQGRLVTRSVFAIQWEGAENQIIGCIGSVLGPHFVVEKDFTIGWFAPDQSVETNNGLIRFRYLPDIMRYSILKEEALIRQHPGPMLTANLLLQDSFRGIESTENLVPSEWLKRFQIHRLYWKTAMGFLAILLGLVIVFSALQISIYRYEQINKQLQSKIERIQQEGLYAGKQIDQLKAVHSALKTHNDFNDMLLGLYEATPSGVTYSHIELMRTGEVVLRGNSPSLSSLFLLPERLEKQTLFERVQLVDAGQTNRSGGSIAEFVIRMQFTRK